MRSSTTAFGCWPGAVPSASGFLPATGMTGPSVFRSFAEALNALKVTTCLLDGEAVTCTGAGLADFDQLRYKHGDVHLCAFDLVESNQPPSSIPTDDGGLAHSRGGFL
jgi:hypothetical protein